MFFETFSKDVAEYIYEQIIQDGIYEFAEVIKGSSDSEEYKNKYIVRATKI